MQEFSVINRSTFSLQVALGKWNTLLAADYAADKLPSGMHSVKGAGAIGPDPADVHKT